jgi:AcrR family transcriptional regulator
MSSEQEPTCPAVERGEGPRAAGEGSGDTGPGSEPVALGPAATRRLESDRLERIRDALGDRAWHELSLDDLARAAGLTRMTFHRRGISRDMVRDGLVELLVSEYEAAALPALSSSADAPERMRLALESVCRVEEHYLGLIEGLGEQISAIYHEPGDGAVLTRGPFVAAIRRILQDGARERTLDPGEDLDESATLLFNATGWTYRHMRSGHHWPPEKARPMVVALLIDGIRR